MRRNTISFAISIALSLAFIGPVLAQTGDTTDATLEAEEVLEEVIVTGSRLRRDGFNVSTPLVTMDNEAIQDTGLRSLAEMMVEDIPQVYEMASNTNGQSYVNATGLTTVSLRNQGSDRTLILIDGRRAVSNQYSSNTVSLNTIPASMIQRIEIITGGSSATYGSDAIAGVINIITQQDSEGFGFETRYGWTPEGGGEELSLNMDYGTRFADNRGYFFFGAEYNDQKGIDWSERDRAQWESSYDYNTSKLCNEMNTWYGDQCMRDIDQRNWAEKSDGTAGGVFEEGRGNGGYWYTWQDGNNTFRDDWLEERDGVNPYIWDKIKIPEDRWYLHAPLGRRCFPDYSARLAESC